MPKTQYCRNGCGIEIQVRMDDDLGKWRPFEYNDEEDDYTLPHDCPNSSYNKQGSSSGGQQQQQFKPKPKPKPQFQQPTGYIQNDTPKDVPKSSQGGIPLDTKRILQVVTQMSKSQQDFQKEVMVALNKLAEKYDENMIIDTKVYNGQSSQLYDVLAPFLTHTKTALDLMNEKNPQSQAMVNHSKIADDKQNFVQDKKYRPKTKFIDETRQDQQVGDDAEYDYAEDTGTVDESSNDGIIEEGE